MAITTYNAKNSTVSIDGGNISGWGEDDKISIEPNADLSELTKDTDGQSFVSNYNDDSTMVTITLMQESTTPRTFLEGIMQARSIFSMAISVSGRNIASNDCFITKRPNEGVKKKIGQVEYKICMPDPTTGAGY